MYRYRIFNCLSFRLLFIRYRYLHTNPSPPSLLFYPYVFSQGEANFILVIQKHPKLVTFKSQAYRIRCVYKTGVQTIDYGFNVSMLTTAGTIANTGPPPTCSMRICNSNGEDISRAEVGDSLMLKVRRNDWRTSAGLRLETASCSR